MEYKELFPWVVGLHRLEENDYTLIRDELVSKREDINKLFTNNTWQDNIQTTFSECRCLITRFKLDKIEEIINPFIKSYLERIGFGPKKYKLAQSWLNVSHPYGFQGLHVHGENYITGTVYLDCEEGTGDIQFSPPLTELNFKKADTFTPANGDIIVFHGQLPHRVLYNKSQNTRLSLTFNYYIDHDDLVC